MAIKFENHDQLLIVYISGIFQGIDLKEIKSQIKQHERINILILFDKNFKTWEKDIRWVRKKDHILRKKINKLAFVGDFNWKEKTFLFVLKGLIPVTTEYFSSKHQQRAHTWLD